MNAPSSPSGSPDAVEPALDAAALARLRELDPDGRHGVVQRVLTAFETSLTRMQGQLAAERGTPDPEVVKSVAHTLKSSSASVGALSLAQACAALERGLREGTVTDLDAEVHGLLLEAGAALRAVGAMLHP
jgi:HPt (histidine-containing phosphotransfer) domain-containing protein